ncbi:MAG TPA: 50S ribosomal protein L18 [Candidatus Nanoarchaeia archaeon]|nr:50S ribosomal protein L18 [Candidatus Nanoarchaeia archaeon]
MINQVYTVQHRRKRIGKTDYRKRLKLLLGHKPRLVVRKSLKHISLQIVEFEPKGDKVLLSAHSSELRKHGWKASTGNLSAAYLTGLLLAKKAGKKLLCVTDLGQQTSVKGCVLYAAVQGAIDGGLDIPCSKEIVPSKERIRGDHVAAFAKSLKANKERYARQFGSYLKANLDPEKLPSHFDEVKAKIGGK